jgi:uncharacterized membrane protein
MKKELNIPNLEAKLHWGRLTTWLCYGALLIQLTLLNITEEHGSIARWVMQCLPLLLVLPGMIIQRYKTYSWLCFILLLYFTAYVVEVGSPLFTWTDATGLSLTVAMFISAMMTSRWLQHWQVQQAQSNA